MTITLNIASDYTIFDNYEAVTLTSADGGTTSSSVRGIKETLSQVELRQGPVNVTVIRTRWHLFKAQLGTQVPQEHGYITDANNVKHYIDTQPRLASWDTRYEVETTTQAAATLRASLS